MPDLKIARRNHSSLGRQDQVYVACGVSDGIVPLSSVEMLRLGADEWELIEIPDLAPRYRPILSQINSDNICILGGGLCGV